MQIHTWTSEGRVLARTVASYVQIHSWTSEGRVLARTVASYMDSYID